MKDLMFWEFWDGVGVVLVGCVFVFFSVSMWFFGLNVWWVFGLGIFGYCEILIGWLFGCLDILMFCCLFGIVILCCLLGILILVVLL